MKNLKFDTPLVDDAMLDQLGSIVPKEQLSSWIDRSLSKVVHSCDRMATLPAGSEELAREAHTLAGSAGQIGFARIHHVAMEIENRTRYGGGAELLLAELKRLVVATSAELRIHGFSLRAHSEKKLSLRNRS